MYPENMRPILSCYKLQYILLAYVTVDLMLIGVGI